MKLGALSVLCLVAVACQDTGIGPSRTVPTRIGVLSETSETEFHLGDTIQMRAYRLDASGLPILNDTVEFYWTSSDTTVFTVDADGRAAFVGLGAAEVVVHLRDTTAAYAPSPRDTATGRASITGTFTVIDAGPVLSAALSYTHQCIVRAGGAAFCRGLNADGQLGDASQMTRTDWVAVTGGQSFISITSGRDHTCALRTDGHASCWGRGHRGQIGNGNTTSLSNPTPIEVLGGHQWSMLDAGGHAATCGIVTTDNVPYCFGHNDFGQVGREPLAGSDPAVAPIAGSHHMVSILTEHGYTCGLETDGAVYCTGFPGDATNTALSPTAIGTGIPSRISGAAVLTSISIGYAHGCGLTAAGVAWCWGENESGQLGSGDEVGSGNLRQVVGAPAFRSIHAFDQASCGITSSGDSWCWGRNTFWALGRMNRDLKSSVARRVKVPAKLKWIQSGDEKPEATCAITESGQLVCWGGGY